MPPTDTFESQPVTQTTPAVRVASIDVLRALTMVLMIFVNDLWSLKDIPLWLEHVESGVDGIGLADVVFPAFLFIVGMSLPFAINNRKKKGDTTSQLLGHIVLRAVALVVMGVFLVNGEYINEAATGLHRLMWNTLSCVSFILLWNAYPKKANIWLVRASKGLGLAILLTLAILYRGGGAELNRFSTYWWGILGLIGWSYLASALIAAFAVDKFYVLLAAWVGFCLLSMVSAAGLIPGDSLFAWIPGPIGGGTLAGLSIGGVLTSFTFQYYRKKKDNKTLTLVFMMAAFILIGLSIYTRTFWGLAKLGETPAWLFLCSAFTILAFTAIYWIADVYQKASWFNFIKPAGTDTLLCYLIPYFAYALTTALKLHLPEVLLTGPVGLVKSFLFALLCVWITGKLNKTGVRLKL
jgi:heparan-alpha-glucosaminide N-acetyltransferase